MSNRVNCPHEALRLPVMMYAGVSEEELEQSEVDSSDSVAMLEQVRSVAP